MPIASRLLPGVALLAACSAVGGSRAADLPERISPPPPFAAPAPPAWSGPYIGGFAGYSFLRASQTYAISSATLAQIPGMIPLLDAAGSQNLSLRGVEGGVEAGYDWRVQGLFVLGAAADADLSGVNGARTTNGLLAVFATPFTIRQGLDRDWGASARLRAGVTPTDNLLLYATGGGALAEFGYSQGFNDTFNETESKVFHAVRLGWTVGAGAEWAFLRNWTLKAEYRHTEYAAVTGVGGAVLTDGTFATANHSTGAIREDGLRLGADYHF